MDTRRGLFVTDDIGRADAWMAWLRSAGYVTIGCVGPGLTFDCPRVHGGQCILREVSDVAIVDLGCDEDAGLCTKIPNDNSTVFVRRGSDEESGRQPVMARIAVARHGLGA